jgi:hypothetical protein
MADGSILDQILTAKSAGKLTCSVAALQETVNIQQHAYYQAK